MNAVFLKHLDEFFQNQRFQTVDTERQGFNDQHIGKFVDHDARKEICFAENQAAAAGINCLTAVFPSIADAHFDKSIVDDSILFAGKHPHGKLGAGVDKTTSERITVKIFDTKDIAIFKFALNSFNFIIIDPHTAGFQGTSLAFADMDNCLCIHHGCNSPFI